MSEYLIVLGICVLPTLLMALLHPRSDVRPHLGIVISSIVWVAIPFWIWDVLATHRGHWSFNPRYILGFYILNLPLEEILFFLAIPFSCVFLWFTIRNFTTFEDFKRKLLLK